MNPHPQHRITHTSFSKPVTALKETRFRELGAWQLPGTVYRAAGSPASEEEVALHVSQVSFKSKGKNEDALRHTIA